MALDLSKFIARSKYTEIAYLRQLQELLPPGPIWEFTIGVSTLLAVIWQDMISPSGNPVLQDTATPSGGTVYQDQPLSSGGANISNSLFGRLLSCFATELRRVEDKVTQLQDESVPGLSTDLLPDWEYTLGLPGECSLPSDVDTLDKRRETAHEKFYGELVTVTTQYLIDTAADLGFTVTVNELQLVTNSFTMGVAIMGFNELGGWGAFAVIEVTVEAGGSGDVDQLECVFNKIKPAHTVILWIYL